MPKGLWWFAHPLCTLDQAGWFIAFKFLALGFERNNVQVIRAAIKVSRPEDGAR